MYNYNIIVLLPNTIAAILKHSDVATGLIATVRVVFATRLLSYTYVGRFTVFCTAVCTP